MPSFDVVSEVDMHEINNAVDQANRELDTRFDFKGSGAKFAITESTVSMAAPNDFQLKQMFDILTGKMSKRGIDVACLRTDSPEVSVNQARQAVNVQQGIDQPTAKKIVKLIKDQKMKVQASIQGDKVRVSGKKRDDLQEVIGFLKDQNLDLPLQFDNFRD